MKRAAHPSERYPNPGWLHVTIAPGGRPVSGETETDGLPLECTFLYPKDIAMDSEENFYIAGGAGLNVRKLAIE